MRSRSFLLVSLLLPLAAFTGATEQLALQPQSRLWVDGTSTVRSFTCKAEDVNAVVNAAGSNSVTQLIAGEKTVQSVDVTVPSAKMDCGNGTMNDHMRKAIKADENATIAFHMTSYEMAKSIGGVTGTLNGTLTLGGVKKAISFPAEGRREGDALHITGGYDLKMTDWDLTPPSLMFGRIKVREMVNVKFDLVLKS